MEEWATQEELGRHLGIDAQAVGELLADAGLKVGRQATDAALARGLAAPDTSPLGRPFLRWRTTEVLPLLRPLVRRTEEPEARRPEPRPRRRSAPSKRPVQGPGTTFDAVVALHAVAEPSPGPTGWAYVDQRTRQTTSGGLSDATDGVGQLVGVLHLLEHSPPDAHLLVRSASEYLVKTATVWGPTWRRNGWRKRDGQRPDDVELVEQLLAKVEKRSGRVRFGLAERGDEFIVAAARGAAEALRAGRSDGGTERG